MPDQPHRMFQSPAEPHVLAPSSSAAPAPARIIEKLAGFMVSKTLFTAIDVGLFAAAGNDGATVTELAERCGIPARSARALADLLTDEGLLIREGVRFRNAADAELFLTGRGPFDLRPLARYWETVSYPAWTEANRAFRTRRGVRGDIDKEQTEAYESAVALVTAETAADLARDYDFTRHRKLLDVGGGIGTFVRPLLEAYANLTATLVDLPEVVEPQAAPDGVDRSSTERLTLVGADIFATPLPSGHDAILLANVIHLFPPDQIRDLLRRTRDAITSGGRLLLVDWWRTADAPHPSSRFGAGEFLMISGGDLYHVDEVTSWLTETGWRFTEHRQLPPPSSVIVAEPA